MNRILLVVVAAVTSLSGCASARYVEKNPDSGIVAIPSNANFWPMNYYDQAKALIVQHVGPDYEIVHEKEVVTGVTTHHNQQVKNEQVPNAEIPFLAANKQTVTNTTSTSDRYEYQIVYRRRPTTSHTLPSPVSGVQPASGTKHADDVQPANSLIPSVAPPTITETSSSRSSPTCTDCKP